MGPDVSCCREAVVPVPPTEAYACLFVCYLLSRACIWFWLWGPDSCKEERRTRQAKSAAYRVPPAPVQVGV